MADDEDSGAKAVVLKLFGEELGERLAIAAGRGKGKNYRAVLEPTNPVTQCEKSGHPFVAGMPCYICGQPIPDKKDLSGPSDELYVECEHVLPVTEGRWFLDIYMSKRPPTDPWTQEAVNLEYEQAHRVCNQAKSNFSFIKTDPETNNPVVSSVGIRKILLNIQVRARNAVKNYTDNPKLKSIMETIATTILGRADAIRERVQMIIDHINEGAILGNPNYKNMVVLLRTAFLFDPATLPGDLRTIHDEWFASSEEATRKAEELLQEFVNRTYLSYPQLRPENLMTTLFGGILSQEQMDTIIGTAERDQNVFKLLQDILTAYFAIYDNPKSTEKTLLSSVYYGVYKTVIESIIDKQLVNDEAWVEVVCKLYGRVSVVTMNEPKVVEILGALPQVPENIKTRCEILTKNAERQYRIKAREENLLPDIDELESPPTPEEDANYFLNELAKRLAVRFAKDGFPDTDTTPIETLAKEAFIEAYPEGILRAKEAAAGAAYDALLVALFNDPDYAERIASATFRFILKNRTDETTTYGGGLEKSTDTLPNAEVTSGGSARRRLYAGLRKRSGSSAHSEF